MVTILCPFGGVLVDVARYLFIITVISYDVLMKGFLPQRASGLLRSPAFHLSDDRADRRGGNLPPAFVCMDVNKQMNMIGHDHIFIDRKCGVDNRNIANSEIDNLTICGKLHNLTNIWRAAGSRPYGDGGENASSFRCAYRDEIRAGGTVIIVRQAERLAPGQTACLFNAVHRYFSSMR